MHKTLIFYLHLSDMSLPPIRQNDASFLPHKCPWTWLQCPKAGTFLLLQQQYLRTCCDIRPWHISCKISSATSVSKLWRIRGSNGFDKKYLLGSRTGPLWSWAPALRGLQARHTPLTTPTYTLPYLYRLATIPYFIYPNLPISYFILDYLPLPTTTISHHTLPYHTYSNPACRNNAGVPSKVGWVGKAWKTFKLVKHLTLTVLFANWLTMCSISRIGLAAIHSHTGF